MTRPAYAGAPTPPAPAYATPTPCAQPYAPTTEDPPTMTPHPQTDPATATEVYLLTGAHLRRLGEDVAAAQRFDKPLLVMLDGGLMTKIGDLDAAWPLTPYGRRAPTDEGGTTLVCAYARDGVCGARWHGNAPRELVFAAARAHGWTRHLVEIDLSVMWMCPWHGIEASAADAARWRPRSAG